MRLKRPRPASPDQVRITREGETGVIEYADPSVRVVNLQVGSVACVTRRLPAKAVLLKKKPSKSRA